MDILRIIKEGFLSLYNNTEGETTVFSSSLKFLIIPLVSAIVAYYYVPVDDLKEMVDPLMEVMGIFVSIILGVIFVVPDKLRAKAKELSGQTDDATRGYLVRFKNFTKNIVGQLSLILVFSILLILLLLILKVMKSEWLVAIDTFLLIFIFSIVLKSAVDIKIMVDDDIDRV
jgi:hypothetical protein